MVLFAVLAIAVVVVGVDVRVGVVGVVAVDNYIIAWWWLGEKNSILTTRTTSNAPVAAQMDAQLPLETPNQESKETEGEGGGVLLSKGRGKKVYQASWSSQAREVVKQIGAVSVGC